MKLIESIEDYKILCQRENKCGIGFDSDDTLYNTTFEYHKKLIQMYPSSDAPDFETLRKVHSIEGRLAFWGENPQANDYAHRLVDCPEFHSKLVPLLGAVEWMNRINKVGKALCHITSRSKNELADCTINSLTYHGFPDLDLIMKINGVSFAEGRFWKTKVVHQLYPVMSGLVDNDVQTAEALLDLDYQGQIYIFGISENDYKPPTKKVHVHKTWEEMGSKILSTLS